MNTPDKNHKKKVLAAIKLLIVSFSITSMIGLWNLFSREDNSTAVNPKANPPEPLEDSLFTTPLPTLVPSVLDSDVSEQASQPITEVTPPPIQPTPEPVIEKVVIGNSGGSGSGSPSTRTSSSR